MNSNGHKYERVGFTEDMECICGALFGPDPSNDLPCPGERVDYDDPHPWGYAAATLDLI